MASLKSLLPTPIQSQDRYQLPAAVSKPSNVVVCTAREYGSRENWIPRNSADYGDGGAYPECHVAQHPLDMGSDVSKQKANKTSTLSVTLDTQGKVDYGAIARQGHASDKIVHSKYTDLIPDEVYDESKVELPDQETLEENIERTRRALEKVTNNKISAAMPVKSAEKQKAAQYIRYTPSQQGLAFNSGAKQRVIRLVEVQRDPMSPPRFKINTKIPQGPPSPPAPVLHSPTRKLTVKEQQDWRIPPCISNWKNAKGFTVPLDKRMAADGRGLQQVHINENFAKLSESLYIADRKSREQVEMRAQLEKKMAQKEKERKEEGLRELAKKARDERAGIRVPAALSANTQSVVSDKSTSAGLREREALRQERHKDRARERNLARSHQSAMGGGVNQAQRERERDISEQIALGKPARPSGETQFDQRLFNQSHGLDSGFHDDEAYNVYDKPWNQRSSTVAQSIYRPSKNVQREVFGDDLEQIASTKRFVPDKGFEGAVSKHNYSSTSHAQRSGPVQFEKRAGASTEELDPFGIDQFLTKAKQASKRAAGVDGESSSTSASRDSRDKRRKY